MLKKIKNFMDKPITWGSYIRFGCICWLISMAIYGATMVYLYFDNIRSKLEAISEKIRIR